MTKRPVQPTAEAVEHFRNTYRMLVNQTGLCVGKNHRNQPHIRSASEHDVACLADLPYVDVTDQTRKNR